jgi:hypothetical protein
MPLPDVPYHWQEWHYSCTFACLRMALACRFPHLPVPTEYELGLSNLGMSAYELFQRARQCGLSPEPLALDDLEAETAAAVAGGFLVIACVPPEAVGYDPTDRYLHAVLILDVQDDQVVLQDPRRHTEDDPVRFDGLRLRFADNVQRHLGELAARRIDRDTFLSGLPERLAMCIPRSRFFDRWYNGGIGIDPTANDGLQPGEAGYLYAAFMV